jgi:hypothetical protein
MKLSEACDLAQVIHGNSAYIVLAVGRFIQPELIDDRTPWGLSVLRREDNCRLMLWSENDWRLEAAGPPAGRRAPQAPAPLPAAKLEHEVQLSLFE